MNDYYLKLFRYDKWATGRIIESLKNSANADRKAYELLSHLLLAQAIWYERITANVSKYKSSWDILSMDNCERLFTEINNKWVEYLSKIPAEELNSTCSYKNTNGEIFNNNISDILTHVINHSTHHRAQISALIRQRGGTPPPTDYIVFTR